MNVFSIKFALLSFSLLFLFSACSEDEPTIHRTPHIDILLPVNESSHEVGDIITISAQAFDDNGSISEVRFFVNGNEVGSLSAAPYDFDWDSSNESAGTFVLKVEAIDDENDSAYDEVEITLIEVFTGPLVDIEGNGYTYANIGDQCWMTENLATATYNDGTDIPNITGTDDWKNLQTAGFSWFDNDQANNKEIYGALYNWWAVETEKLCPLGWHVPTEEDWLELVNYLGGEDVAGVKLKEEGTNTWLAPNNANNESGFTALGTGYRHENGDFNLMGEKSMYWAITPFNPNAGLYLYLKNNMDEAYVIGSDNNYGFCVRCIKDQ